MPWVARRGIRVYISRILEAEATLARGDQIVEEISREARKCRKAGEQEKHCDGEPDGRLTVRRPLSMRPVGSVNLPQHADQHHPNDPILLAVDQQLGAVVFGSTPMTRPPSSTRASASTITRAILLSSGPS